MSEERPESMRERKASGNEAERTLVAYFEGGGWSGYLYHSSLGDMWTGSAWSPEDGGGFKVCTSRVEATQYIESQAGNPSFGVWRELNIPLPPVLL